MICKTLFSSIGKVVLAIGGLAMLLPSYVNSASLSTYKNPDWGYELTFPSEFIAIDRANIKEKVSFVPENFRILVDELIRVGWDTPGTVYLLSNQGVYHFDGELSAEGQDFTEYLVHQLRQNKSQELMPEDEREENVRYQVIELGTGSIHEFDRLRLKKRKGDSELIHLYLVLIPLKGGKFLQVGVGYRDGQKQYVADLKEIILSFKGDIIDVVVPEESPPVEEATVGSALDEIPMLNGNKHGLERLHYENGTVMSEILWKDGMKDGKFRAYYEDGRLYSEGEYAANIRSGRWLIYEEGIGRTEVVFENGKEKTVKLFTIDGKLKEETLTDGDTTIINLYDENGTIHARRTLVPGQPVKHEVVK